jgi:hypothetical protein
MAAAPGSAPRLVQHNHAVQHRLRRSSLGARPWRSRLRKRFHSVLQVPLPRIFCLNTRKGLASNAQFRLLRLKVRSVRTDSSFGAHLFTSHHCVADVVPADGRGGEHRNSADRGEVAAAEQDHGTLRGFTGRPQVQDDRRAGLPSAAVRRLVRIRQRRVDSPPAASGARFSSTWTTCLLGLALSARSGASRPEKGACLGTIHAAGCRPRPPFVP